MTHRLTMLLIGLIQLLCFIQLTKKWLYSADKKTQSVFVANRAAEILENSTIDEWMRIEGKLNPSDFGKRGITLEKLTESDWLS